MSIFKYFVIAIFSFLLWMGSQLCSYYLIPESFLFSTTSSPIFFGQALGLSVALICIVAAIRLGTVKPGLLKFESFNLRIYLIGVLLLFLSYLGSNAYEVISGISRNEFMEIHLGDRSWSNRIYLFVAILILAPIAEEIIFRGILFGSPSSKLSVLLAMTLPAVLFAAIHIQYPVHIRVMLIMPALIFSWARWKTGSLVVPILLHTSASVLATLFFWMR